MNLGIHHLALRSADPRRVEAFYAGILGLELLRRDLERGSVWLSAGGAVVMIEHAEPGEPAPREGSKDLVAFAVDPRSQCPDLEAWRTRLAQSAIPIEAETPFTIYFRDPEG